MLDFNSSYNTLEDAINEGERITSSRAFDDKGDWYQVLDRFTFKVVAVSETGTCYSKDMMKDMKDELKGDNCE